MPTLTAPPDALVIGDSLSLRVAHPDTPRGGGWSVTPAHAVLQGQVSVAATSVTDDGDGWLVTWAAAATARLTPGAVQLAVRATNGADAQTIVRAACTAERNVALQGDQRSHAARMLAAIEARLEGRITADVEAMSIAGRSLTMIPIRELRVLRAKYAAEVAHERRGGRRPRIEVAFRGA